MDSAPESNEIAGGYSGPKKKILYYLKVMQQAQLRDLAEAMKISKMAVHKHLAVLQERGLVESIEIRKGVGRPKMFYQLTNDCKRVFPKAYNAVAVCALDFIERNMGKEGVEKILRERQSELYDKYYPRLKGLTFDAKVKELARIRDEEGYIAESKKHGRQKGGGSGHILLEYNCPILEIAEKHGEACSTEVEMFEKLLDAKVEATHRAANGDRVCRFEIQNNS
ncbi:helix-turn-helix transcriptional regulator [Nitrososphaera viennensis]|uniref:ArsR family transcriptional regulator n=2 Tax=Nitrososphaera viennensis TaxID=1034015 RepID=A0A977NNE0_9ARCH|nr:ArsR family transcriptional regulator [Nitrososphaera viennensis]AIC15446.1 putative transcriptional regulator [Nitrososphaera viennensis EN76]UVS70337.1 ArsR family transcriptional regulator [Nitrososphaera viennensis]